MSRKAIWILIGIILVIVIAVNFPGQNQFLGLDTHIREGLDLVGGIQIVLQADVPDNQSIDPNQMNAAGKIIESRVNALGLSEPLVQVSLPRRIVVELPGFTNEADAEALIENTALLEFVEVPTFLAVDTEVQTDYLSGLSTNTNPIVTGTPGTGVLTPSPLILPPTLTLTPTVPTSTPAVSGVLLQTPTGTETPSTGIIYTTLLTGADLTSARVGRDQSGKLGVEFTLSDRGAALFGDYTSKNVGGYLAIVLDKKVISCPQIESAITSGNGIITGNFTIEEANQLAIYLSYGSLPIPFKKAISNNVGPTLGQDSLRRSLIAGAIGLIAVVLFMLLYYRLPGVLASLALGMYALTSLTIYRLIPVTFTLPGIAGFILSVGMAVDANVLIFERMKEELRGGRVLRDAVDTGFARAWTSIRDSNISTLITCAILVWFGGTFGASIVKGFAITLAIGVLVSMFTAIVVTRNLLHLVLDRMDFSTRHSWFGIQNETSSDAENQA
jgi:preprotein translocase subunit SecD